jgi:hypothetical protein
MEKIWLKQDSGTNLEKIWKFRGFSARFQVLKHNYAYKPRVYSTKEPN